MMFFTHLDSQVQPAICSEGKPNPSNEAVLKRADNDDESQKVAEMVTLLLGKLSPASLYRLPRPMAAVNNAGTYIQGGWAASQYIHGKEGPKYHFRIYSAFARHFMTT